MLPVTQEKREIIRSLNNYHSGKLEIQKDGVWYDLSKYLLNWKRSENNDLRIASFTCSLFNSDELEDILPESSESIIYPQRKIRFWTATCAPEVEPKVSDWRLKFEGFLGNDIPVSSDMVINLDCQDKSKRLQDVIITYVRYFGGEGLGKDRAQVLQDIINAYMPLGHGIKVWYYDGEVFSEVDSSTNTGTTVVRYKQDAGVSVWDALQRVTDQHGWDLRYKFVPNTGQFELVFWLPNRDKIDVDDTFDSVKDIEENYQLNYGIARLRNTVVVHNPAFGGDPQEIVSGACTLVSGSTYQLHSSIESARVWDFERGLSTYGTLGIKPRINGSPTTAVTFVNPLRGSFTLESPTTGIVTVDAWYKPMAYTVSSVDLITGKDPDGFWEKTFFLSEEDSFLVTDFPSLKDLTTFIHHDLSGYRARNVVTLPYYEYIEVFDLYRIYAEEMHERFLDVSVLDLQESGGPDQESWQTTFVGMEEVVGSLNRWLLKEQREGNKRRETGHRFSSSRPPVPEIDTVASTFELQLNEQVNLSKGTIVWNHFDEGVLAYVLRYRKVGDSGWSFINSDDNSQEIFNLEAGKKYEFGVKAIPVVGSPSLWSQTKTLEASPDTEAPRKPSGVKVDSILKGISVKWDHPTNLDGLSIARDWDHTDVHVSSDPGFAPTDPPNNPDQWDGVVNTLKWSGRALGVDLTSGLSAGETYYVRLHHYDIAGNQSEVSDLQFAQAGSLTAADFDKGAPDSPVGLSASVSLNFIGQVNLYKATLSWDSNSESDMSSYELAYRSDSGEFTHEFISHVDTSRKTFSIPYLVPGEYGFKVRAIDIMQNKSGFSNEYSFVISADTTPILTPDTASWTVGLIPGGLEVRWDKPAEEDWAYTEVYLSRLSGFNPTGWNGSAWTSSPNSPAEFDGISKTLIGTSKGQSLTINSGLIHRTNWYVKIVHVDINENRSSGGVTEKLITIGSPKGAIVIAAHDASEYWKATADYICTGVNDNTVINTATGQSKIVELSDGNFYVGEIVISSGSGKDGVYLFGQGDSTVLHMTPAVTSHPDPMFTINADRVRISSMKLNGNFSQGRNSTAISGVYTNCEFDYLTIYDFLYGVTSATGGSNNNFNACEIHDISLVGMQLRSDVTKVSSCKIHDCGTYAIEVLEGSLILSSSQIADCPQTGVRLGSLSSNNVVNGNKFSNINYNAVSTQLGVNDNVINNNTFEDIGEVGILLNSDNNTIVGNTFLRCGMEGILVTFADENNISSNVVIASSQKSDLVYSNIYIVASNRNSVQLNICRVGNESNGPSYGIRIGSLSNDNLVTNNDLLNGGKTAGFLDGGTNTITTAGNRGA